MLKKLNVYYNGWGEYWLWGTLVSSTAITGRPLIAFEYSAEAISKGLELSSYLSVHDKFHRALVLSGFFFLKIARIFLNSSFFPKPIKRRIAI